MPLQYDAVDCSYNHSEKAQPIMQGHEPFVKHSKFPLELFLFFVEQFGTVLSEPKERWLPYDDE